MLGRRKSDVFMCHYLSMQFTMSEYINIVVSLVNYAYSICGIWLIFLSVLSAIYVLYNWNLGGLGFLVY